MLTFLPMEEVERLSNLPGEEINKAKEILAFEVTRLVHGDEEARKAQDAARALFAGGGDMANVPSKQFDAARFEGEGLGIATLMKEAGLASSTSDAFRTIEQGGLSLNGEKVTDKKMNVTAAMFDENNSIMLKKGKKTFLKITK